MTNNIHTEDDWLDELLEELSNEVERHGLKINFDSAKQLIESKINERVIAELEKIKGAPRGVFSYSGNLQDYGNGIRMVFDKIDVRIKQLGNQLRGEK